MTIRGTVAIVLLVVVVFSAQGQVKSHTSIKGRILLDDSWSRTLYLCHIPAFDDMYVMSHEMIIAKTVVDSLGYFNFDISYLPEESNLFRLHVVKQDDSPATLIIGGRDENHLFLIADRSSDIRIKGNSLYPPFKRVVFENSLANSAFQRVTDQFFLFDSLAVESTAAKRLLIENQLERDLLLMADTSSVFLVSLYAIYKNHFLSNHEEHKEFYLRYIEKWSDQENAYFQAFKKQLPEQHADHSIWIVVASVSVVTFLGGVAHIFQTRGNQSNISKLSVQERKIYLLLQQGASNQEISDHFNIELSTVKSHVSSIYAKLNVKSRKGIVNIK